MSLMSAIGFSCLLKVHTCNCFYQWQLTCGLHLRNTCIVVDGPKEAGPRHGK